MKPTEEEWTQTYRTWKQEHPFATPEERRKAVRGCIYKVRHISRAAAEAVASKETPRPLHDLVPYLCKICRSWHCGNHRKKTT